MEIVFEKKYLKELYHTGQTADKKHRFQPEIIRKYKDCIRALQYAERIEEVMTINSFNYKILKGDKKGISSIRVNDKYRIEFTVKNKDADQLITICNILELSNHYK